jgi:hypothetical protein
MCLRALAQLAAGNSVDYRTICRQLEAGLRTDPENFLIALTCLAGPGALDDYGPLKELTEDSSNSLVVGVVYLGVLQYRAGKPADARESLRRALRTFGILPESAEDRFDTRFDRLICQTYLALACRDLGLQDEMRSAAETAKELLHELENDLGNIHFPRPVIEELARQELRTIVTSD